MTMMNVMIVYPALFPYTKGSNVLVAIRLQPTTLCPSTDLML